MIEAKSHPARRQVFTTLGFGPLARRINFAKGHPEAVIAVRFRKNIFKYYNFSFNCGTWVKPE